MAHDSKVSSVNGYKIDGRNNSFAYISQINTGIHTNFNGNTKYICASVGYNYNERGILGKCASRNGEWVFVHRLQMCRFERQDWIDSLHERLP